MRNAHKDENATFGLFIIDLDKFKEANDTYGHMYGDKLLLDTATAMKSVLMKGDVLARIGGDEFAIIIYGMKTILGVQNMSMEIERKVHDVTGRHVSVGGTLYTDREDISVEGIMASTDAGMYASKNRKRPNPVVI